MEVSSRRLSIFHNSTLGFFAGTSLLSRRGILPNLISTFRFAKGFIFASFVFGTLEVFQLNAKESTSILVDEAKAGDGPNLQALFLKFRERFPDYDADGADVQKFIDDNQPELYKAFARMLVKLDQLGEICKEGAFPGQNEIVDKVTSLVNNEITQKDLQQKIEAANKQSYSPAEIERANQLLERASKRHSSNRAEKQLD